MKSDPIILAVTTTHRVCGVAVGDGTAPPVETLFEGYRSCIEELVPRVYQTLEKAGLTPRDLGAVAVDIGPGGLTGLKIGIVIAKTTAQALSLPMIGLSSFEILAADAPEGFDRIAAVVHSSRDEFHLALLRRAGGAVEVIEPGECINRVELERRRDGWAGRTWITGGGLEKLDWSGLGPARWTLAGPEALSPSPARALDLAAAALRAGAGVGFDRIAPLYISPVNAEKNLGRPPAGVIMTNGGGD